MTALDIVLVLAGFTVTALVVAAMILITPRGAVDLYDDATDRQGSDLSRADGERVQTTAHHPHEIPVVPVGP